MASVYQIILSNLSLIMTIVRFRIRIQRRGLGKYSFRIFAEAGRLQWGEKEIKWLKTNNGGRKMGVTVSSENYSIDLGYCCVLLTRAAMFEMPKSMPQALLFGVSGLMSAVS